MKRLMGLMVSAFIVSSLFAGCGGDGGSSISTATGAFDRVVTPLADEIITDEYGNDIAINYALVCMKEGFFSIDYINPIVEAEGGQVVGSIPSLSIFQVKLTTSSIEELNLSIDRMASNENVEFVTKDVNLKQELSVWANEVQHYEESPYQREANRVEQGTSLYVSEMAKGSFNPTRVTIGVAEKHPNVDLDIDDFSSYANDSSSHGVSLEASDWINVNEKDEPTHASIVTGVIAADVGNGRMGGLLPSLDVSSNNFHVVVDGQGFLSELSEAIVDMIEKKDASIINMSFGIHVKGTLDIYGKELTDYITDDKTFNEQQLYYANIFQKFPNVTFVVGAGNVPVDINSNNSAVSGLGHFYNNVTIVSGHKIAGNGMSGMKNDNPDYAVWSGDCLGNNVDIVAQSVIGTFPHYDSKFGYSWEAATGTSFSAPLVSATIAAMKSINPNLIPSELINLVRVSALPIKHIDSTYYITKPLNQTEIGPGNPNIGMGARLNVVGAIQAAIDSLSIPGAWYQDGDNDGFGNPDISISAVSQPDGYVKDKSDCNDTDININTRANETYDNLDNNCNGLIDEGFSPTNWYADNDNDKYGNENSLIIAVTKPVGYVSDNTDCNDSNRNIYPGAPDTPDDGIDQDCSGSDATTSGSIGTVTSLTGRVWMDRNLGASQVATAYNDSAAYGDLYQWGRGTDGHEKPTSPAIGALSSSDTPGHGSFIKALSSPYDWRNPQNNSLWQGVSGVNNPCPSGFRLPTETEWEVERATWSTDDRFGAFASPLKLVLAGFRRSTDGWVSFEGRNGYYWSSSDGRNLYFDTGTSNILSNRRANGFSVRCLED